ncbi:MAG: phenylalanine--tRNA ligase subunit beta [Anaerolineaceae bacterium]|nr:phenylalanine--tRNA ligase subunit beta [Anaerolineaceae bacterium]
MKITIGWLADFIDLSGISVVEIAQKLTMAGMQVEDILFAGLPLPTIEDHGFKVSGIEWDPQKIVVAEITAVNPHPNADRLTLCDLYDGVENHVVLTGAPNLFEYKGKGPLAKSLKVAYAKEGARIYDGHADGLVLTTLKRSKIRGVDSYSMVCSEKELGISEEHDGVIILDEDAVPGTPLVDYMGDAVLEVNINPNMARNTSILGVARELSALTGRTLRKPDYALETSGESIESKVKIEIAEPVLNPRFTIGLIRGVKMGPSPYWVQRRLRLCGVRAISNVVDATNYTMIEIGEPLHAFDYSILAQRARKGPVVISTRTAKPGEKLTTLDGVERKLTPNNLLVCDTQGALSLAGVMGGAESEISDATTDILLEAAAWNFINIRKTATQHALPSEASYRFSRGVHPGLAIDGLRRCLRWMAAWSGGTIAPGIVDNYPLPPKDSLVLITEQDVRRALGIEIPLPEIQTLLERLEFTGAIDGDTLRVQAPPIRMDIGEGLVGVADVMEEVARLYGFDRIPESRLADPLPPQRGNPSLEREEQVRDALASLGMQEIITHRMTSPENEARLLPKGSEAPALEYVKLANPVAPEKRVLRRSLLSSVLNVVERNARLADSLSMFEVGGVFLPSGEPLPLEPRKLAIAMTGKRYAPAWDSHPAGQVDFFDLKGLMEALMDALHVAVTFAPAQHPSFHPGKCAQVLAGEQVLGVFGELHPRVQENYDFAAPVVAAEIDLEAVLPLLPAVGHPVQGVIDFPSVLEDIAVVVDEAIPAARIEALIRQTGGKLLAGVRLFDIFRGPQIGEGKKSMAYGLTYQAPDRTLTDKDAAQIRGKIIRRLEQELGAKLRS